MPPRHPVVTKRQNEIRAWIEGEIVEGHLRPGDRIDEREICQRFGVSRTPVRDALLQLASVELVAFRPRQGAMVACIPVRRIAAMWEVMTALEGLCAELAARRMDRTALDALGAVHAESRRLVAEGDVASYDVFNRDFHEIVYVGCRNEYLAEQVRDIRCRLRAYRRYPFQKSGGMERSLAGHEAILKALNAGEDVAAGAAMREHVAGGMTFLDLVAELPAGARADDGEPTARAESRSRMRRESAAPKGPPTAAVHSRPRRAPRPAKADGVGVGG